MTLFVFNLYVVNYMALPTLQGRVENFINFLFFFTNLLWFVIGSDKITCFSLLLDLFWQNLKIIRVT